jgi:hypothetical protein
LQRRLPHAHGTFEIMTVNLSTLAIVLGLGYAVPQAYALTNPKGFSEHARRFSRSLIAGYALMLLATAWFLYNVSLESIADFAAYKPHMMVAFGAIGIGCCVFVTDFLAVRGLAVLLLLLAKLMVDAGRPHLGETPWVLINQTAAYGLAIIGVWWTVAPYRLRDWIDWNLAGSVRFKAGAVVRLAAGVGFALLGWLAF